MNGWALGGLVVFGLFALLGLGDGVGLLPGFAPSRISGLASEPPFFYSALPSLLSLALGLTAGLTLLRVLQGKRQRTAGASRLVGYTFMAYGIYQLALAMVHLDKNPALSAGIGVAFVLMGFLVRWLGWRVARAL